MRKCLRCGAEMREGCTVKVEGAGYGVVLSTEENKIFSGRIGKPRVAVCPECGEAVARRCPQCGRLMDGDPKFCPECGEKLR